MIDMYFQGPHKNEEKSKNVEENNIPFTGQCFTFKIQVKLIYWKKSISSKILSMLSFIDVDHPNEKPLVEDEEKKPANKPFETIEPLAEAIQVHH